MSIEPDEGEGRARGPLYFVIAAVFVPFLALLFPYLVLDDYQRSRALAAMGTRRIRDPKRAPRKRDLLFWGPALLWSVTLLAIPVARGLGELHVAAALLTTHLFSLCFSTLLLMGGWFGRDKRSPEEKQAELAVREAQVQAFFTSRDAERKEAGATVDKPAVPWIGRGVWMRWFLLRWDPEQPFGDLPLGLSPGRVAEHATPVPTGERDAAPVAEVVGDWSPRKVQAEPAPKPPPMASEQARAAVRSGTPSPFPFPGLSWPVCDERLAVLIWEGNVGLPPDSIGLPMGVPEQVEALVTEHQGVPAWDCKHGWDGNAVFQCSACGRLYWRGYEA